MASIKVYCYRENGRKNFTLEWMDRRGRERCQSAGTLIERQAERAAERLSKQLTESPEIDQTKWVDFRKRFTSQVASRKRKATQQKFDRILDDIEAVVNPRTVDEIDTAAIDLLITHYFTMELAPATIAGYLRYVGRVIL